jgi:hypothetical protein
MDISIYEAAYTRLGKPAKKSWEAISEKLCEGYKANSKYAPKFSSFEALPLDSKERDLVLGYSLGKSLVLESQDKAKDNLAVKIFFCDGASTEARQELEALHLAQEHGISSVPKPIGIKDNILVESVCHGLELEELKSEEEAKSAITDQQIISLLQSLDALIKLGIAVDIDAAETNLLYDITSGFSILGCKKLPVDFKIPDFNDVVKELRKIFNKLGKAEMFKDALAAYKKIKT